MTQEEINELKALLTKLRYSDLEAKRVNKQYSIDAFTDAELDIEYISPRLLAENIDTILNYLN